MFLIFNFFMQIIVVHVIHISLCGSSINEHHKSFDPIETPYVKRHGSRLNYRSIRECQRKEHGSVPHEIYTAYKSPNITLPFVEIRHFVKVLGTRVVQGHFTVVTNPMKTISVLEPDQKGGCNLNIRQTVVETAKKNNCVLAVNAGFFDTKQGKCLGNVISDGEKVHNSHGVQNAHFGLTEDENIFIGYVSEDQFLSNQFKQLVGGVVWILRNSSDYVNVSKVLECEETEESGTMEYFISMLSARTSIGHDKNGNIVIVQVEGKSGHYGMTLYEMQDLLKGFGLVNAINLDGGGSSTLVHNSATINYPSDSCPDERFSCDRKVSTIVCVHSPYCDPKDCNNHGDCQMGVCMCKKNWLPPACDQLSCGRNNCSSHGFCSEEGCLCNPGYYGEECDKSCPVGRYGIKCEKLCNCMNQAECDHVTGSCLCSSGFMGDKCQFACPYGYFGKNCSFQCQCRGQCYCDTVTGSCESNINSSVFIAASCMANVIIEEQHLVKDNPAEKRKWFITMIILGVITATSITAVLLLLFCSCSCRNEQVLCSHKAKKRYQKYPLQLPAGDLTDSSESESVSMKIFQKR